MFLFVLCASYPTECAQDAIFTVTKVIDGDTLTLNDGTRVRLIGVDTPELHHPTKPVQFFAEEAYKFTRKLAEGKKVRLAYDWQKIDKYDRTLAYVYLMDGTFINAEIIKKGYGFAYTKYPFKYLEDFRKYEKEAREKCSGLWAEGGKPEYKWLITKGIKPILLYPMAGNFWIVKYDDYYLKISNEAVNDTIDFIKYKSFELTDEDLESELISIGWEKQTKGGVKK